MNILIYGSGAIGTYLGVQLTEAGHSVELYGRNKLQQLTDTVEINGETFSVPQRISAVPEEGDYDTIFCTTKMVDVPRVVQDLQEKRVTCSHIIFIQNGLAREGMYGELEKHPGFSRITVFQGYELKNSQIFAVRNEMGWQTEATDAGTYIANVLQEAGIGARTNPELDMVRSEKMLIVASASTLSALYKKKCGELHDDPDIRTEMEILLAEGYAVLSKEYSLPPFEDVKEKMYQTLRANKDSYTSMCQDILSGRQTEIDFANGIIIELGKKYGLATFEHELIYQKIKRVERESREGQMMGYKKI